MFSSNPHTVHECRRRVQAALRVRHDAWPARDLFPYQSVENVESTASFAYLGVNFEQRLASREFFLGDRLL